MDGDKNKIVRHSKVFVRNHGTKLTKLNRGKPELWHVLKRKKSLIEKTNEWIGISVKIGCDCKTTKEKWQNRKQANFENDEKLEFIVTKEELEADDGPTDPDNIFIENSDNENEKERLPSTKTIDVGKGHNFERPHLTGIRVRSLKKLTKTMPIQQQHLLKKIKIETKQKESCHPKFEESVKNHLNAYKNQNLKTSHLDGMNLHAEFERPSKCTASQHQIRSEDEIFGELVTKMLCNMDETKKKLRMKEIMNILLS